MITFVWTVVVCHVCDGESTERLGLSRDDVFTKCVIVITLIPDKMNLCTNREQVEAVRS
jgi:hypothetical protein